MLISLAEHLKPLRPLKKPHVGTVVDNVDPKGLQRVKIVVKGIFEGDKAILPWVFKWDANPKKVDIPKIGDQVWVYFPFDDVYHPFYDGAITTTKNKSEYLSEGNPNTFGFEKTNIKMKFNDETKKGELVHSSGTKAELKDDGSLSLTLNKNLALALKGDASISADGTINISGKAGVSVTSDGEAVFSGKAGTTIGDSGSVTNVNGSQVMLAGGGVGVAVLGSDVISQAGNLGAPVLSKIMVGSSKVFAPQ